jgi:hypothetical protein
MARSVDEVPGDHAGGGRGAAREGWLAAALRWLRSSRAARLTIDNNFFAPRTLRFSAVRAGPGPHCRCRRIAASAAQAALVS